MAKPPNLPSHAVRLASFAELEPYVRAFGAGHLNLLMIFGPPGVGKSRSVRQALGSQVCWIGGQATPFGIYLHADVAALEDRGHLLLFEPTPLEVHRQAARWFWDQEIFDFIADHLHLTAQHSLRTYCHAWELKRADLDWRQGVLCRCLTGVALAVAKLKANPAFGSEDERVRTFVQSGAGCRASYFRHAQKLRPAVRPPKILLTQSSPPVDEVSPNNHLEQLRRRFGRLGNG